MHISKILLFVTLFVSYSFGMAPVDKQLFQAIATGDQKRVQDLLNQEDQKVNINASHPALGGTPVYAAAYHGRDNIAELLINAGADVTIPTNVYRVTPLHVARTARMARMLLDHGADINARDSQGRTPLDDAINRNNIAVIKVLLDRGADTNARDSQERTLLDHAINSDNVAVTQVLFDHNADFTGSHEPIPGLKTTRENNLLRLAVEKGLPGIARFAIERDAFIKPNYVAQARNKFEQTNDPIQQENYKAIGRMLLRYFDIVGQHGLGKLSKEGFALPDLPDHIREIIATYFATQE